MIRSKRQAIEAKTYISSAIVKETFTKTIF